MHPITSRFVKYELVVSLLYTFPLMVHWSSVTLQCSVLLRSPCAIKERPGTVTVLIRPTIIATRVGGRHVVRRAMAPIALRANLLVTQAPDQDRATALIRQTTIATKAGGLNAVTNPTILRYAKSKNVALFHTIAISDSMSNIE